MTFKAHPVYGRDGHQRRNRDGVLMWKAVAYINGRQRARTFPAKNQRVADVEAERIRSELRKAVPVMKRYEPGSLGALAADWLADKRRVGSPSSVKGYKGIVAAIDARFGHVPLTALTREDVRAWYNELLDSGMTPATLGHYHAVLRGMLSTAFDEGKVPVNVASKMKVKSGPAPAIRLPKDAQLLKVLEGLTGELAVAVRIAAACGLRRGEIVALRWSSFRGRTVSVAAAFAEGEGKPVLKSTKTNRERRVAVDPVTMRMLAAHRRAQRVIARANGGELAGDWFVLANLAADPAGQTALTPGWLSHAWQKNRGPLAVGLHGLRHWYATKVMQSRQASIVELSSWLGHSQTSTTVNIYTHASPERARVSADIMGPLLPHRKVD